MCKNARRDLTDLENLPKKYFKNKCKIMCQICVILKILKISRDRIYLPDRRVSRAFFLSSSSGYRGISWEVCKELYFSKSFAIFRCTSISRTGSGKGRPEMYPFFMPFSVSAQKKHRHRRNVTSHHSFSLLWQFQLLKLSSLDNFHH